MTRRSSLTAVLLALAVLAGACSNSSEPSASDPTTAGSDDAGTGTTAPGDEGTDAEPPSDFNKAFVEGEPAEGGSITIGVEATVASLDPAGALTQVSDIDIALALYDPLVAFDDEGGYAPSLATEWSNSDDLKTWTITVRDDVTFNDGTPFDADAVVQHFARLKDPATNCVCATEVALISSVEAPDPTTVVFTLAEPNAFFIDSLADVIGYIASPTATTELGPDYGRNPVGTGAFKLKSYDPLVLERNPDYWRTDDEGRALPYLDEITVRAIPESPIRLQSLQSGDIDVMQVADTATIIEAIEAGTFTVQKIAGSSALSITLNNRKPPFDDLRMRQAIALAVNRDELNNVLYKGARQPAYSQFATTSPWYAADAGWLEYDPERAKELVAEAKADGVPTEFDMTCVTNEESRNLLNIVKRQLADVGMTANLEFVDQGAYVNKLLGAEHDFVSGCSRNGENTVPDLYEGWYSTGSFNAEGFDNEKADAAMVAIRQTTDEAELKKLSRDLQVELATDVPAFPLLYDLFANVASEKVSGLPRPEPNKLGAITFANLYLKA